MYAAIDRILQNINARTSNGIVVGPEFSRMIAEILLQKIDMSVHSMLLNMGVVNGEKYNVYRYVDDIQMIHRYYTDIYRYIDRYIEDR